MIFTPPSLQGYEIEDFGYRLGRPGASAKDKDNGVILIVAPTERKVRIEVGRGLEPNLTDLMSKLIIENAILPAFRRNDFAGGIKAGVHDIRDVMLGDAEAVKERARAAKKRSSDGGNSMATTILILFILVAFAMVWMQSQQAACPNRAAGNRRAARRRDGSIVPFPADGVAAGGWSGGGGDGGGGGFSGGGGDFGGGGSSGSW